MASLPNSSSDRFGCSQAFTRFVGTALLTVATGGALAYAIGAEGAVFVIATGARTGVTAIVGKAVRGQMAKKAITTAAKVLPRLKG
jgi:hypothetical protein